MPARARATVRVDGRGRAGGSSTTQRRTRGETSLGLIGAYVEGDLAADAVGLADPADHDLDARRLLSAHARQRRGTGPESPSDSTATTGLLALSLSETQGRVRAEGGGGWHPIGPVGCRVPPPLATRCRTRHPGREPPERHDGRHPGGDGARRFWLCRGAGCLPTAVGVHSACCFVATGRCRLLPTAVAVSRSPPAHHRGRRGPRRRCGRRSRYGRCDRSPCRGRRVHPDLEDRAATQLLVGTTTSSGWSTMPRTKCSSASDSTIRPACPRRRRGVLAGVLGRDVLQVGVGLGSTLRGLDAGTSVGASVAAGASAAGSSVFFSAFSWRSSRRPSARRRPP